MILFTSHSKRFHQEIDEFQSYTTQYLYKTLVCEGAAVWRIEHHTATHCYNAIYYYSRLCTSTTIALTLAGEIRFPFRRSEAEHR